MSETAKRSEWESWEVFRQRLKPMPDRRTIRTWIEKQWLPGKFVGPHAWINVTAWEAGISMNLTDAILGRLEM